MTEEFVALMVGLDRLVDEAKPEEFRQLPDGLRRRLIVVMHAHMVFRDLCARYDAYVLRERLPPPIANLSN
ncbi:MAG: hypothetical protein EPO25_06940 [Gammaproteobacteria bacterium]|nr:MAG: hypothetical protein EPO25_06940 [Gammaproteobacteria bacterium]